MNRWKQILEELAAWPGVSVHPHRFGGREFRVGGAELGHVHTGGTLDIPFPRPVRDQLLAEGLAEQHHWVPDSGWVTFHLRREADLEHARWLLRLSYLRYALKAAADPRALLEREGAELRLNARYRSLLEPFVPAAAQRVPA